MHQRYALKPSRVALGFQFFSLLCITILLSFLLNIWLCILLLGLALLILKLFRKQSTVICLEQLDHDMWSLQQADCRVIQQVKVKKILNHSLYIVITFQNKEDPNLIIWCDQLSKQQWKSMQTRARLN